MKNIFLKLLYRIFSFFADKTNGWKIFVTPKLFLGTLILGITAISVSSCQKEEPNCYVPAEPPPPEVTCYDQVPVEPTCYVAPPPPDATCYFVGPTSQTSVVDTTLTEEKLENPTDIEHND